MPDTPKPVLLAILDGWGIEPETPGNAVVSARTPTLDRLAAVYPRTELKCSGEDVGLPDGQMGNSEVGHLNIGAGFIVYQWITRIDLAIREGTFYRNSVLKTAMDHAAAQGTTVHLVGLVSEGGVHSHIRHLFALLELAKRSGVEYPCVHAFTDGRDTPPQSGAASIAALESELRRVGVGRIASVSGRYFAMDRDHRWDRIESAFKAIASGEGPKAMSAVDAVRQSYLSGVTDEFIKPVVIPDSGGTVSRIEPDDTVILFNFRSDRVREITDALSTRDFNSFDRGEFQVPASINTLTTYDRRLEVHVAFAPHDVEMPLARVISDADMTQFHTAETEKYAHVTFFLNGGREDPYPGETRILEPSPKVATYDLQPAMSAQAVADGVVDAIRSGANDFIVVNFANCDMVGHTGDFDAAVNAVETVDTCLNRILQPLIERGGVALVTADHGNAERMIASDGSPFTSHTTNPVPVILVSPDDSPTRHAHLRQGAVLSAIAPTVLDLMGIPAPPSMTQASLIERQT